MACYIKLDHTAIARLGSKIAPCAELTMETVLVDVRNRQVMPFDTGHMQNDQTSVEKIGDGYAIVTDAPQARRLYYHPEYNFQRGKNANAGGMWLQDYMVGKFVAETFPSIYKRGATK